MTRRSQPGIYDGLEQFIYDLLSEVCPLLSKEQLEKESKNRVDDAATLIEIDIDILVQENDSKDDQLTTLDEKYNDLLKRHESTIEEKNDEINDLEKTINDLLETIDDLRLKLNNPPKWMEKNYNI